jgi:hypothetical protein
VCPSDDNCIKMNTNVELCWNDSERGKSKCAEKNIS